MKVIAIFTIWLIIATGSIEASFDWDWFDPPVPSKHGYPCGGIADIKCVTGLECVYTEPESILVFGKCLRRTDSGEYFKLECDGIIIFARWALVSVLYMAFIKVVLMSLRITIDSFP
ncbi:hypothetical protein DPMN_009679 [Dreissena polymorpha]|uniref:Secreted protein n=1 Tax=Dreissena polymorpha TaxID=45954 RepID=A0A9D4N1P1_DREPO|nr:hypothetical protein DPMN_009679 [Dreissena polymorpha]